MRIILLGPPGAGKGTQSSYISTHYNIPALSTGDILRKTSSENTELAAEVRAVMESGGLVSDELMISIIRSHLSASYTKNGFILDGFPRTDIQASALQSLLQDMDITLDAVIYFNVPASFLVQRIIGRFSCKACGKGYHKAFLKPLEEGVCDSCGGTEFISRNDDTEDALASRLKSYYDKTQPLVDFYNNSPTPLLDIDGTLDIDIVRECIFASLEAK